MYERLTDGARKVAQRANQIAQKWNHEYIGTEHLLLGLVDVRPSAARTILDTWKISPGQVEQAMNALMKPGPSGVRMGRLPYTPRAKKVMELAMQAATEIRHDWAGTQHLLLGLVLEEDGFVKQILTNLGVTVEKVQAAVLDTTAKQDDEPAKPDVQVHITVTQQAEKPDEDCTQAERWERIDQQIHGYFNQGWSTELTQVSAQFFYSIISAVWSGMASRGTTFGLAEPFMGRSGSDGVVPLWAYWAGVWSGNDHILCYFSRVGRGRVQRLELPVEYLRDRLHMATVVDLLHDASGLPVPDSIAGEIQTAKQEAALNVQAFAVSLVAQTDKYLEETIRPYMRNIILQLRAVYPDLQVQHSEHRDHAILQFKSKVKGIEDTLHGQQLVKIAKQVHELLNRTIDDLN